MRKLVPVRALITHALSAARLAEVALILVVGSLGACFLCGIPLDAPLLLVPIGMAAYAFIVWQQKWSSARFGDFLGLEIEGERVILHFPTHSSRYRLKWFSRSEDRWILKFPFRLIRFWAVVPVAYEAVGTRVGNWLDEIPRPKTQRLRGIVAFVAMAAFWALIALHQISDFFRWRSSGDWIPTPATIVEWKARNPPLYQYEHHGEPVRSNKIAFGIWSPDIARQREGDALEIFVSPDGRKAVIHRQFARLNYLFLAGGAIASIGIGIACVAIYRRSAS